MTEEVSNAGESTEQNVEQKQEYTPAETEALASGWVPKEEFLARGDAEEHKWVDAGEFLRRGELFRKIEDQSKQLKDVRSALNEMKKLHSQVREVEYKRALDALREQKRTALQEGDADAVIAAEERIDLVKEQAKQLQQEPQEVAEKTEHPEFVQWTSRNAWYKNSAPMKAFADALGRELAAAGNAPAEVLKKVEAEVRKEFPNKFRNPNQDKPNSVETGQGRGSTKETFVLTDQQRKIMNNLVRQKVMTEKQYIEDLKSVL